MKNIINQVIADKAIDFAEGMNVPEKKTFGTKVLVEIIADSMRSVFGEENVVTNDFPILLTSLECPDGNTNTKIPANCVWVKVGETLDKTNNPVDVVYMIHPTAKPWESKCNRSGCWTYAINLDDVKTSIEDSMKGREEEQKAKEEAKKNKPE